MDLNDYQRLNKSFSKKLIFHLGTGSGFFSEYNNMIKAMAYCLQHKIQFVLYSADASFVYEKGWQDFFDSFTEEVTDSFHSQYNKRFLERSITRSFAKYVRGLLVTLKYRKTYGHLLQYSLFYQEPQVVKDLKKEHGFDYFTYDLWSSFQEMDVTKRIEIPGLYKGTIFDLMKQLDKLIWQFNEHTEAEVQKLIDGQKLPVNYFGMQIRGGDKFMENSLLDYKLYFQTLIRKKKSFVDTNAVFVLTDDYRIIDNINAVFPQFQIYTLCSKEERGYFNESFKSETDDERKAKIIRLFASIQILANSAFFIGTESANPGKYLKLRLQKHRFYSLD
ncbi:hypothetical protein Palpr_1320 [Paludibacter propionicigenes WB4]|uniref:Uncharacterized protein n=1 Tax=Paludibacter propionicigenes (strain DSM 17365 / JCM 13257 / WB4) TaxID=694427 RepID=E4T422_PALPW|nr:hypothetical protein [Paludibacter propionicigenes]ADQ79466.1 hypothetical protein Palpr_1320 [Paludibacter propionicigenes WB4]